MGLLLLLSACTGDERQLQPLFPDSVVLAYGDSLTFGTGANRDEAYPFVLASLINRTVINAGRSGETSSEGVARLGKVLKQYQPDLLILAHGGNDLLRRYPDKQTKENLRQMVELAQGLGVDVMLVAIPKPGVFLNPAPFYAELAEEMQLVLEPDIITYVEKRTDLKSDAIHPNAQGYRHIATGIATRMAATGAVE